jgi:NAD(P)H-dependent flavin oxidoreductase YrpB (nitropropane dioxygenase family)
VVRTPICDRLGIEFPIFAFSHCRDVVAAVSRAGGFGVLGALAFNAEELEVELSWIDDHVDGKPYGVDIVMPNAYMGKGEGFTREKISGLVPPEYRTFVDGVLAEYGVPPLPDQAEDGRDIKAAGLAVDLEGPGQVEVALKHPTRMLVNALGPPPKEVVDRAHEHGILVGALVGSPRHAVKQVEQGVDIIVAQGTEAGGHTGEISTMVLIPDVVDAVGPDVPVLAAGGIGSGRQMAAALALGAQGAWTGSIWLTVAEADTNPVVVDNLLRAGSRDTVRSRSMTGKPARLLRNAWTDAWERPDAPKTLPMPLQGVVWAEAARRFTRAGTPELNGFPVGQIVGRMNARRPAGEVVHGLVEEWIATTQRLSGLIED